MAPARGRSLLRVGTLTREIQLLGSTRKKLIDLVLDAIGASRRAGGLSLEDFRKAGKTRKAIIKGEYEGGGRGKPGGGETEEPRVRSEYVLRKCSSVSSLALE